MAPGDTAQAQPTAPESRPIIVDTGVYNASVETEVQNITAKVLGIAPDRVVEPRTSWPTSAPAASISWNSSWRSRIRSGSKYPTAPPSGSRR